MMIDVSPHVSLEVVEGEEVEWEEERRLLALLCFHPGECPCL